MILVADRCALSPQCMTDMKRGIIKVVSEFVILDQEEAVDLNMTADEATGALFSVSIPVRRVKPGVPQLGPPAPRWPDAQI